MVSDSRGALLTPNTNGEKEWEQKHHLFGSDEQLVLKYLIKNGTPEMQTIPASLIPSPVASPTP